MKNLILVVLFFGSFNVFAKYTIGRSANSVGPMSRDVKIHEDLTVNKEVEIKQGRAIASDEIILEKDMKEKRRGERFERMQNRRLK